LIYDGGGHGEGRLLAVTVADDDSVSEA